MVSKTRHYVTVSVPPEGFRAGALSVSHSSIVEPDRSASQAGRVRAGLDMCWFAPLRVLLIYACMIGMVVLKYVLFPDWNIIMDTFRPVPFLTMAGLAFAAVALVFEAPEPFLKRRHARYMDGRLTEEEEIGEAVEWFRNMARGRFGPTVEPFVLPVEALYVCLCDGNRAVRGKAASVIALLPQGLHAYCLRRYRRHMNFEALSSLSGNHRMNPDLAGIIDADHEPWPNRVKATDFRGVA